MRVSQVLRHRRVDIQQRDGCVASPLEDKSSITFLVESREKSEHTKKQRGLKNNGHTAVRECVEEERRSVRES
jgi:hypothetical protein